MFKKKQKKQAAFTFVEVLVATMLTAIVMTAFGSMMALSMRVAEGNEMEQLAQLKAQQVMEFFRRERLIRGWNIFFDNLTHNATYCMNNFPDHINQMSTVAGGCPSGYQDDFNFFYYNIEANITQPNNQSVVVEVQIYRYAKGYASQPIGSGAFFTVEQTFKQY